MRKYLIALITILLVALIIMAPKLKRLYNVIHLFDADVIQQNFQNIEDLTDVKYLNPSTKPLKLVENKYYSLPDSFTSEGIKYDLKEFLDISHTEGLLIIHNDTIIYEDYQRDLLKDEAHISWSMAKSFVSTLAGVMIDQGKLDIYKTVDYYLPDFKGTGYENVVIEDVMQMSSGVTFNEDYGDFYSDINRFGRVFALGKSFADFSKSLKNGRKPGTFRHYVSIDTQVLAMIISKISGRDLTDLTQEYIWEPCGMEHQGYWIADNTGFEMGLGGLNATLRDYSKLGLMYLHNGSINGSTQILSEEYIRQATTPLEPHLLSNSPTGPGDGYGYGYQWWIPPHPDNDFYASGIYHQFVYVNRTKNLVIAKLSADPNYNQHRHQFKRRHVNMFQDIANKM